MLLVLLLPVTCGSTIKLAHGGGGFRLHSQRIPYSRGSGQQSVTAFPLERADAGSYWTLHGTKDAPCLPGSPISKGARLRLQHAETRKWLHSSSTYLSPLSGNQEVSAYGSDGTTHSGDVWAIDWAGKEAFWRQDAKVTLQHAATRQFLHSMAQAAFGHPISGQREVCAVQRAAAGDSEWSAAEGIYLPRADAAPTRLPRADAAPTAKAAAPAPAPAAAAAPAPAAGGVSFGEARRTNRSGGECGGAGLGGAGACTRDEL
ncbi:MAG: MIR motif-containing protein [Monoraphidium minutum]|nr:MAG: MIR motif-containing protein [Monoraphidium minutum]